MFSDYSMPIARFIQLYWVISKCMLFSNASSKVKNQDILLRNYQYSYLLWIVWSVNLFVVFHLLVYLNCDSCDSRHEFEEEQSWISLTLNFAVVHIFGVQIDEEMLIIELVFFSSGWRNNTGKNFLDMLDIDEVWDHIGFFQKADKRDCWHSLILQLIK